MIRKIENALAVALIALIAALPLFLKFMQGVCRVQVPGADIAVLHFVFLFASLAGLITWRDERHLSLASVSAAFDEKIRRPIEAVKTAGASCILSAFFIDALCQLVNPAQFDARFWGMSTRIFFASLPLCYFGIIVMTARKKNTGIAALIGIVLGISLSKVIGAFGGLTTTIDILPILVSFSFAVGIGLFFGIYPARKAARLDPIDALRYE